MSKNRKIYTIGLLIDWIENPYHIELISGVVDTAKKNKVNLFNFIAGAYNTKRNWEIPRNLLYDIINIKNIDGLIISTGSISNFSGLNEIENLCQRYHDLPIVSISHKINNICSILVDNEIGFKNLILHLIEYHKYKNFVFIKGPRGNHEADIRFNVFKKLLAEYDIKLNDKMIYQGDFNKDSGFKAVEYFIDNLNLKFDAIVASNDDMAWGVIEALKDHGLSIPKDVAVVGFDDVSLSKYMNPPLTTVKQPLYDQGKKSVELLLSIIKDKKIHDDFIYPSEMIIRESCGCILKDKELNNINKTVTHNIKNFNKKINCKSFIDVKNKICEDIRKIISDDYYLLKIDNIIDSFCEAINKRNFKIFYNKINSLNHEDAFYKYDFSIWQEIISILRQNIIPYLESFDDIVFGEELLHNARLVIIDFLQRTHGYSQELSEVKIQEFRDISERLCSIKDTEDLTNILIEGLPKINIKKCFLSLYKENDLIDPRSSNSKLFFAFNEKFDIKLKGGDVIYPTIILLPEYIKKMDIFSLYVEPIYFGSRHLGLVFFEIEKVNDVYCNIMQRMFLNSAFKLVIFVQYLQRQAVVLEAEVEDRTEALSKTNRLLADLYIKNQKAADEVRKLNEELEKRVKDRTKELRNTLNNLKNTQEMLVQSEKMAALGGLVAGIAHEINTPIGIGVTAVSHLETKTKELMDLYKKKDLKKSDFEDYLNLANEASVLILSNLKRAYDLITSFKKIAVDQTTEEKRKFNVKEYINETLMSLNPQLKKTDINVAVNCPENLFFNSYPGAFSQIITNLVMNSLIHAYDKGDKGKIKIVINIKKDLIEMEYSDNGKGISEDNLKKIFDPFFTTKRNEGGTGLGLNLVFNIVTQRFDGSIKCNSRVNEGTTFIITFSKQKNMAN